MTPPSIVGDYLERVILIRSMGGSWLDVLRSIRKLKEEL